MSRSERVLRPDRSARDRFGYELRRLRKEHGYSLARLAGKVHVSADLIQKIETAERKPGREIAGQLEKVLQAGGALLECWQKISEESRAGGQFLESFPVVKSPDADTMGEALPADAYGSDTIVIPCRTDDGRIIWVSVPRRAFLLGGMGATITGLSSTTIKSSSAALAAKLLSASDSPFDRYAHMRRLLRDTDNCFGPKHVMPLAHEQINTLSQLSQKMRGTDRIRLLQVQAQFADLVAWFHQDSGYYSEAQYWLDRALDWSYMTERPEAVSFLLARKSQLASDANNATDAIDMATAATSYSGGRARSASIAATYAAHGYALQGDKAACQREYDRAYELLTKVKDEPNTPYGLFLDESYIAVYRAHSLAVLGAYVPAADAFGTAIESLPQNYYRDRGVYLVRKALAHVGANDLEQAAVTGFQALSIGVQTGSGRIINGLDQLNRTLRHQRSSPGVADFLDAFHEFRSTPSA